MNAVSSDTASSRRWRWHHFLWVLLALAAIVLLRKGESRYEDRDAPILQRYTANEEARGRNFTVRIKRIKVAHAYLLKGDYGKPDYELHTPGVWLSVLAEVEATQRPGAVQARILTRDGLVYDSASSDRPRLKGINLEGRELATALPAQGAYFFELPPDRLEGAHLQVYWGHLLPNGGDSLVDIDLGIDAARAKALLAEAKPVLDLRP